MASTQPGSGKQGKGKRTGVPTQPGKPNPDWRPLKKGRFSTQPK